MKCIMSEYSIFNLCLEYTLIKQAPSLCGVAYLVAVNFSHFYNDLDKFDTL